MNNIHIYITIKRKIIIVIKRKMRFSIYGIKTLPGLLLLLLLPVI